jgi:Tol biopolymer transport system component
MEAHPRLPDPRVRRWLIVPGLLAALAVLAFATRAWATVPGTDGLVAINHTLPDGSGLGQVITMNADGTDAHALALPFPTETFSTPVWSPDGSRLLVSHVVRLTSTGDCCLPFRPVIADADGSNARLLTMPWAPFDSDCLAWTPDQTRLLCGIGGDTPGVFSVRASDGLDPVRLTTNPYASNDAPADVSPDGDRFVFFRYRPGPPTVPNDHAQQVAMCVENMDGSGLRQITGWGKAMRHDLTGASWSPDGTRIVGANVNGQLFTVTPDGSGTKPIQLAGIPGGAFAFQPHWSPSGARIIFGMFVKGEPEGIYTARPNGSDVERVTSPDSFDDAPTWAVHR